MDQLWAQTLLTIGLCVAVVPAGYGQGMMRSSASPRSASLGSQPLPARSAEHNKNSLGETNQLGVWFGGSVHTGGLFGNLRNGRLSLVGLRYSRRLLPRPGHPVEFDAPVRATYTLDLIPASWLVIPKGTRPGALSPKRPSLRKTGLSTFGFGTYPLGLQLHVWPRSLLQPFVAGQTGVFYFLEAFPDARGNQLNFAAGLGGGIRIRVRSEMALILGYQYHHLSNGFRASINPGLDGNLLYVGANLDL